MENEDRNDGRDAASEVAARYVSEARAVMRRAAVASMANSTPAPEQLEMFCEGCEFIRLLNPDGLGYCKEHGDTDGRENDPRNHTGENL